MKIAVLSDSHDNIWALDEALNLMRDAEAVIHCGDLIAPFVIKRLANLKVPVHIVWGNNDGDQMHLSQVASGTDWIKLHGELAELELHGRKIAVNHYPEIGRALANSGSYDLVCYGHDHTAHEETVAKTLLLNPGEIMGLNGRRTFVKIDLADMSLEWIELK